MPFDSEFSLDRFNLEIEAERNPKLIHKYAKLVSKRKGLALDEKRKLEILEGELMEEYRRNKQLYGIIKDTDTVLLRLVKGDPKYEEQFYKWIEADRLFEDAKAAVQSLVNKGYMISIEAELWLNNYYSHSQTEVYRKKPKRIRLDSADEY
jgi:hypothetical protein